MIGTAARTAPASTICSNLLVVIPAPLHGRGFPRQTLRTLSGRPLLMYSLALAKAAVSADQQIVVLTDDDEVALRVEREKCTAVLDDRPETWGAAGLKRAVFELVERCERDRGGPFEAVGMLEATSPLLKPEDFIGAVEQLEQGRFDSIVSACRDDESSIGEYANSLAGGERPSGVYRETGAFVISRRDAVTAERFVGPSVGVALVPPERSIDILSSHNWWVCERLLRQKRIVFVVAGNRRLGMGHIYRTLQLAHDINDHEVVFVCSRDSDLAARTFSINRYPTCVQGEEPLADTVRAQHPHLVINDFLDTSLAYVTSLKEIGAKVINFEDLGDGADAADLVINALFLDATPKPHYRVGPGFFSPRDEFLEVEPTVFRPVVDNVLITFGGVDNPDLTSRVVRVVGPEAIRRGIRLKVVTGAGYAHDECLQETLNRLGSSLVTRANGTKRISEYMARADVAFSSAGRTVFELAMMRVPAIVMASNAREETHPFASSNAGFVYLGRHDAVGDSTLLTIFCELVDHATKRREMREQLSRFDFRDGKKRVLSEIARVLESPLS